MSQGLSKPFGDDSWLVDLSMQVGLQGGGRGGGGGGRHHGAEPRPFSDIHHHVTGEASSVAGGVGNGNAAAEVVMDHRRSNNGPDDGYGMAIEEDPEISGLAPGDAAAGSRLFRSQLQAQRALGGPAIVYMTFNPHQQEPE